MNEQISILVVDDDEIFKKMICRELSFLGHSVSTSSSGEEAVKTIEENKPDVVLLDIKLPGIDGIETLKVLKEQSPTTEIVMLTGHGTIDNAISSMKTGAYDYLTKPCRLDELTNVIQKAYEKVRLLRRNNILESELVRRDAFTEVIGESHLFRETLDMAVKVAGTNCTVLIQGESGVGKELIARLIHHSSPRKGKPFVVVDCSSLQETLLESELFGHEKGAFTGAYSLKHGLLEVADSGTLFMDEIGEISPGIQAKLLRMLESGTFRRVGGTRDTKVDVRIVVATNRNLIRMTQEDKFRDDLYYRLNVICISIPPLRNRKEDIPMLVKYFLKNVPGVGAVDKEVTSDAMELLMRYEWPGNIREVQNVVHRAAILSEDEFIKPGDLPSKFYGETIFASGSGKDILTPLEDIEKRYISMLLERFHGHRGKVARALKMSERNLYRRIRKYGLGTSGHTDDINAIST